MLPSGMPRSLTRQQVREVDRRAIEEYGIPGIVLMENAGRGTVEWILELGCQEPVLICAGKGNNGGDGFVIARHLAIHGIRSQVLLFSEPDQLSGDASINYRVLMKAGLSGVVLGNRPNMDWVRTELSRAGCIIDALLGTGTRGEIREPFVSVIDAINSAECPVLAVDIPSGLDCDTGFPLGACVRARYTATFVSRKLGFDQPESEKFTGRIRIIDIGIPPPILIKMG